MLVWINSVIRVGALIGKQHAYFQTTQTHRELSIVAKETWGFRTCSAGEGA